VCRWAELAVLGRSSNSIRPMCWSVQPVHEPAGAGAADRVYTLLTTCNVVQELSPLLPVGKIVDLLAAAIGPMSARAAKGGVEPGRGAAFAVEPQVRQVAAALNCLRRPLREVLVLHHVTGREPQELARWLQEPLWSRGQDQAAERSLARRLGVPHDAAGRRTWGLCWTGSRRAGCRLDSGGERLRRVLSRTAVARL